jgi:hypothetical protein
MDKRDHDTILNAYNVTKERLAKKKNGRDSAADGRSSRLCGRLHALVSIRPGRL